MKVSELKKGMLLRFIEPEVYSPMLDSQGVKWISFPAKDETIRMGFRTGQPLMIYLGTKTLEKKSTFGSFKNVRMIQMGAESYAVFPEDWNKIEPATPNIVTQGE